MPASAAFERRLDAVLDDVAQHFGTPFYLYDEIGIEETARRVNQAFSGVSFREHYAVKAVTNPRILRILARNGCGFDCGSVPDLNTAAAAGATGHDIVFSANNATPAELAAAVERDALVNLDDMAALDKLPTVPRTLCFRLNPGVLVLDDRPELSTTDQKFGMRPDQVVEAVRWALARGARRFGLHAMVVTNQRESAILLRTLAFLLETADELRRSTGVEIAFVDLGGGLGIPFRPGEAELDVEGLGLAVTRMLTGWALERGIATPTLVLESGRYMSGPHGVLVGRVTNRMRKWRTFVGVDTGVSAMMRPALYDTAYHHISVHRGRGRPTEVVDVVGSMCENNDKLGTARELPVTAEGDLVYVHDVGAHGYSMGFTYNNRLRPKELLLRADGVVELVRRAETERDHFATLNFDHDTFTPAYVGALAGGVG